MKNLKNTLRSVALAGAVAAVSLGAVAAPAFAQDWHRDRGWHHEYHHGWGYRPYAAVTPGYYAPPPVAYAPAYGYGYAQPGISFTFPIHIR